MYLLGSGELIVKFDRVTGEVVENTLDIDLDDIDDRYYRQSFKSRFGGRWYYSSDPEKILNHTYNDLNVKTFIGYERNGSDDYIYYFNGDEEELEEVKDSVYEGEVIDEDYIKIRYSPKYTYILTSQYAEIYKCDKCKKPFYDYREIYMNMKKRRQGKNAKKDYCHDCWTIRKSLIINHFVRRRALEMSKYNGKFASRPQRYLAKLWNGELNYKIESYFADILLDGNVVVEYDGGGHYLAIIHKDISQEEFDLEERKREKEMIEKGYKILRIISKQDYLPTDDDLHNILEKAKKSFAKGCDVVRVRITKKKFDHLRKISKEEVIDI